MTQVQGQPGSPVSKSGFAGTALETGTPRAWLGQGPMAPGWADGSPGTWAG